MKLGGQEESQACSQRMSSNLPKSIYYCYLYLKNGSSRESLNLKLLFNRLSANTESHLKTLGLRHMPANMREINVQKFMTAPNKDSYVFVRVKGHAPSVLVGDGTGE